MADIDCVVPPAMAASVPGANGAMPAPTDAPASGTAAGHTSFGEFLRAMNPLQHLPVIGTIYRAITGDTIQPAYRVVGSVVGGLIGGGPFGLIGALAGCLVDEFQRLGWNMPDPAAPQSGTAFADAGIGHAATADARNIAPDLPAATALARAEPRPPDAPVSAASTAAVDAAARGAAASTVSAPARTVSPELPLPARLMAGLAAYSWVEARGSG